MADSSGKTIERVQIVLYVFFLFLWFISPNKPTLRLISVVLLVFFLTIQVIKILKRKKTYIIKPVLYYVLFTVWSLLSVIWAQNQSTAIDRITDVVCNSLFLVVSYDFFCEAKISKRGFVSIFVTIGILFAIYVFLYYGFGQYFSMLLAGRRVGGEIINVNFVGLVSTMTVIIILYSVLNGIYKNKLVLLLLIPLIIVALGSGSKKVLIGLVIGVLMIIVLYLKGKMTWKKIATIMLFFVLLIGSFFAIRRLPYFSTVFERMDVMVETLDRESSAEEGSTEARKEFIGRGFHTFLSYPITGIGLNNSGIITEDIIGREVYLHCNYVELLACVGFVGFMLYYAIYLDIFFKTIAMNKDGVEKNYLPIVIVVTLLVVEIGCVTYYEIKTSMYFILMIILLYKHNWETMCIHKKNNIRVPLDDDSMKSVKTTVTKERK